jgi:hypothetical protein
LSDGSMCCCSELAGGFINLNSKLSRMRARDGIGIPGPHLNFRIPDAFHRSLVVCWVANDQAPVALTEQRPLGIDLRNPNPFYCWLAELAKESMIPGKQSDSVEQLTATLAAQLCCSKTLFYWAIGRLPRPVCRPTSDGRGRARKRRTKRTF